MMDSQFKEVERVIEQVTQAFAEAAKPALAKITAIAEAFVDACGGWKAFQEQVAELERWRAEHPFVEPDEPCACLCRARGHDLGTRTVWAFEINGQTMCYGYIDHGMTRRHDVSVSDRF
jgi:hypothetical protein